MLKSGTVWLIIFGIKMEIALIVYIVGFVLSGIGALIAEDNGAIEFGEAVAVAVFWPVRLIRATIKGFISVWKNQ